MIGLITFHAAHNYGSVLQAYATQKTLDNLGFQNEIVNYRLKNQIEFYNHFYTTFFGARHFLRNLRRLPEHHKRSIRRKKFEAFINHRLRLTEKVYHTYEELVDANLKYPILVSGSDQVWNKYCTAEFKKEPPESIYAYYLNFGKSSAARIAVSSSFGPSKLHDVISYQKFLEKYDVFSVREEDGVEILRTLLGRDAVCTLDPTLFFDKNMWNIEGTYTLHEKYVLVYTLRRRKEVQRLLKKLKTKLEGTEYRIFCIAPFSPISEKDVKCLADCGPLDFLSYINSAAMVLTDSFHGTAFSINLETPFYTIPYGSDRRKELLIKKVGMTSRMLSSLDSIEDLDLGSCFSLDFAVCREILKRERQKSIDYINNAIGKFYETD